MAKRKYKKRKTTKAARLEARRKRERREEIKKNLIVVGLVLLSILLAVLIYGKSGVIGIKLSEVLGGMVGIIKYILPVGIFALAIKIACDEEDSITAKVLLYTVLLISIAALMSIFEVNKGEISIYNNDISKIAKNAYSVGTRGIGGGVFGTVLATPLIKLLGPVGASILCIGIVIMFAVFTFGINASKMVNSIVDKTQENREERLERKQKLKEERQKNNLADNKNQKELSKNEDNKNETNGEQIKINLGGRLIEEDLNGLKKYDHKEDDLTPLTKESKQLQAEIIENNLFKKVEEEKQDKSKEILQLEHTITVEDENYIYPPTTLLSKNPKRVLKGGTKTLTDTAEKLRKTLHSFGVSAKVENVSVGPAITRYELKPAEGVRVSKIANLADDIALNLAAETIRIEAPIPGKQAVGIEVPNKEKEAVYLREILESDEFENNKSKLTFALGKDVAGEVKLADIAKMPHVLIAGATGSGKSVCINTIITSIIYNSKPSEVKMVMVDPKVVELSVYNGIPHLLIPVVTDSKKAAGALAWAVQEMDNRYNLFAGKGVRDLNGYNEIMEKENTLGRLPQIVIIVDELADLMMVAAKDVEESICRLAQKARAAGMHLVIATQRPSVDVITGLIKANIPSRIAFAVSSQVDSRTILDMVGAEKLLGKGDMLFYPTGEPKPVRVQGAFVSDGEVEKIVKFVKQNGTATYNEDIIESIENSNKTDKEAMEEDDETDAFLMDAIEAVVELGQASTSFIQRRFKVGYARAGRIIDQMEERGIISGYQGSKPREVLISKDRWEELKMGANQPDNSNSESQKVIKDIDDIEETEV